MEGISHITFMVKDMERATWFFTHVLEAEELDYSSDPTMSLAKEKFFLLGGQWITVMEGESTGERTYNHIAFKVSEEEMDVYEQRIQEAGVDWRKPRPRMEGEGRSLYFYDFDNHLFELHTGTLAQRMAHSHRRENMVVFQGAGA